MNLRRFAAAALLASLPAGAAAAAETSQASPASSSAAPSAAASSSSGSGWEHKVALYIAGVGMSGEAAIGNLGVDVDLSFSEILDHMEIGGMAAYRGRKGNWAIMANALFVDLAAEKDLPLGGTAEAGFDQTLFELDGSRRFAKGLEFYFGARLVGIDSTLEAHLINGTTLEAEEKKTWVDPLVGLRYETAMGKHWAFVGRGDVGGFGLGSDLAWQAMALFEWRISQHFGTAFGYVILDIDYDDGNGSDYFLYDIAAQGPMAAVTFTF